MVATRKFVQSWPFARAVRVWPVKSPAVRRELIKHAICPECGYDVPEAAKNPGTPLHCHQCGWRDTHR